MYQEDVDTNIGIAKYHLPDRSFWIPTGGAALAGPQLLSYLYVDHQTMTPSPTEYVNSGDVVIDIGAHVGVFTNFALKFGAAKVLMLEPDPINVECLKRNFRDEIASGRVILLPEGAWDSTGSLKFHTGVNNSGTGSFVRDHEGSRTLEARIRPVDSMVAELKLPRVDLVKIDIEGAERHALKGMRSVLRRWKPRILIDMYHLPDDAVVLPEVIHEGNPNYQSACQSCEYEPENASIRPHATLFF
jgi:FkbM family methyltransferase